MSYSFCEACPLNDNLQDDVAAGNQPASVSIARRATNKRVGGIFVFCPASEVKQSRAKRGGAKPSEQRKL